jgi:hypothetical protein
MRIPDLVTLLQETNEVDGVTDYHYHVRLTRLWDKAPEVVFDGRAQLYIQFNKKHEVCLIAIHKKGLNWAEHDPRHDANFDSLLTENYQTEVFID